MENEFPKTIKLTTKGNTSKGMSCIVETDFPFMANDLIYIPNGSESYTAAPCGSTIDNYKPFT